MTEHAADDLAAFIDACPSPYHAAERLAADLADAGFVRVGADADGELPQRGVEVKGGQLLAWAVPDGAAADAPVTVLGAHTDSPNLRVRARPDTGAAGWRQIGVEVYGGVLRNSWLDRDLGLSGRLGVLDEPGGAVRTELVAVHRPLLRVAQLAIHLDRGVNDGLSLDPQRHLTPLWGVGTRREGELREFIAAEAGVEPERVVSWDLMLHDLTPSSRLGIDDELLAAPRLDNLASCRAATLALIGSGGTFGVSVLALFDHEEVGSTTATGAVGPRLRRLVERLVAERGGGPGDVARAFGRGWVVSADNAHATHPNYPDRHEPDHFIACNAGPVIKLNANQRYASDASSAARFVAACQRAEVPYQRYVHRNDLPCGSTIGPLTAAELGSEVVDVGLAQLSMHSARELCGAEDPAMLTAALAAALDESR